MPNMVNIPIGGKGGSVKKFMISFAAVASSFVNQAVVAAAVPSALGGVTDADLTRTAPQEALPEQLISVVDDKGDAFDFVLRRSLENGHMMAYHRSHSSHSSHSSHRSHYSSR
jgi:hypothetical protein